MKGADAPAGFLSDAAPVSRVRPANPPAFPARFPGAPNRPPTRRERENCNQAPDAESSQDRQDLSGRAKAARAGQTPAGPCHQGEPNARGGRGQRVGATAPADPAVATRRKLYVFASLVTVMTLTSALLWAMQTAPLSPDVSKSLSATDRPDDMNRVFETGRLATGGRWKYIFIHHSQTPGGSGAAMAAKADDPKGMADHFLIGNGDGCDDGAVEYGPRWNHQEPAGRTPGVERMDPNCISICLVGDFDHTFPTPTQMKSLGQLVDVLQRRLRIDREHVWVVEAKDSPAGTGKYFPRAAFREQLLP